MSKQLNRLGPNFFWDLNDPREELWMIKISNFAFNKFQFLKILKSTKFIFIKSAKFFVLFYNVHTENMFTTEKENEHEAPKKPSKK